MHRIKSPSQTQENYSNCSWSLATLGSERALATPIEILTFLLTRKSPSNPPPPLQFLCGDATLKKEEEADEEE